jgi:hypothetical protein
MQDLSAEPAARLIVDFLTVIIGDRAPGRFQASYERSASDWIER